MPGIGLCACGCGLSTWIATSTHKKRGWIKGEPVKFVKGHSTRGRQIERSRNVDRYRYRSDGKGNNQYLHRLKAERALGKPLPLGAEVHHADGSKRDDAPLVICQDFAYHMLLHRRTRILRAGGNPNTDLMCSYCQQPKPAGEFYLARSTSTGRTTACKECMKAHTRQYLARKREVA